MFGKNLSKNRFTGKSMLRSNKGNLFAGSNLPNLFGRVTTQAFEGLYSQGFKILGLSQKVKTLGGPGEPPPGFVGGQNSKTEWYIYWALTKILGPEGLDWGYQVSVFGGRHSPGGSVVDFVVYLNWMTLGIRIQTYRFHLAADAEKQFGDAEQLIGLFSENFAVVDIYEQDFIYDESGQTAIQLVREAMQGIWRLDPIRSGLTVGNG
jgi:hypothetical protein